MPMTPSSHGRSQKSTHATTGSEIAQTVNATLDLDILLRLVILEITKALHYQAGDIWLLDDKDGRYWFKTGLGLSGPARHRLAADPLVFALGNSEEPEFFSGASLEAELPPGLAHEGIVSLVRAPLRAKNKTIGLMHLYAKTASDFPAEDRSRFRMWTSQAALAIENARMFEDARRRAQELQALHEIAQVIGEMPSLSDGLSQIADRVSGVLNAEKCWFMFYDPATRTLSAHASAVGAVEEQIAALRLPVDAAGVSPDVYRSGSPFYTNDAENEPAVQSEFHGIFKLASLMAVPIRSRDEILGVFLAANKRDRGTFTGNDVRFFRTLAAEAGMVIQNAKRYSGLLESYRGFVQAAVRWTEMGSGQGHAERVAGFAARLAGCMGVPAGEREQIAMAAWLHDVGKRRFRRRLRDNHAELGAAWVEAIGLPWQIAELIRFHHAAYAGGRSRKPTGDSIPLGARILAVADALEHGWRGRLSRRKQQALLRSFQAHSGTRWDPRVIQALEHVWAELVTAVEASGK